MELTHRFTLPASVEQAWTAFYFPNRIAPCFPGATLGRVDGDYFDGVLKIKLGPMPIEYEGTATFLERSPENQRIVVEARGEDSRGRGAITATVAMTFTQTESGTDVDVVSDVALSGQAASFGNTVLKEVSDRLVQRLVGCVSGKFVTGLGDPPTAEELAMARPAKPAVSPKDSTERPSSPVPEPVPQDITAQPTPPAPQPEPQDTTEPATPTVSQPEPQDTTEQPTPPTPQPAAVEPEHEVEILTAKPAEEGVEHPPTEHIYSATTALTDGTPEPAGSAPLSETPEPSSNSVATVALPRLRRFGAPIVGAAVLAAAIGVLRRIRR